MDIKTIFEEMAATLRGKGAAAWVCWSGVLYDIQNLGVRYDKVFLNVVYLYGDRLRFRRVAPALLGPRDRRHLLYTLRPMYRIKTGSRAGCVVQPETLRGDEAFTPTGLTKAMELGQDPHQFSTARKRDREVLKLLGSWTPAQARIEDTIPAFFITVKDAGAIRLRLNRESMETVTTHRSYDPNLGLGENVMACVEDFSTVFGEDRLAFDFRHFDGRGVVVADLLAGVTTGAWQLVPSIEYAAEHIRIEGV